MITAHAEHGAGSGLGADALVPVVLLVALATAYTALAVRRRREARGWSGWRTAAFLAGIALVVVALLPSLWPLPAGDFRTHMAQHLLIGMYAPLGLALGAPLTLVLRSVPTRHGRRIGRILRSGPVGVLSHPVTALALVLGGLALLYCTPLYVATTHHPALHHLVHLHFLLSGYLFAYSIAGADPAPRRPSVPARLVILGVAILGHAVLSQLLYAGAFVRVPVSAQELRGGAELMYFGGDIAELLLALATVTTWRKRGRRPREGDRAGHGHRAGAVH